MVPGAAEASIASRAEGGEGLVASLAEPPTSPAAATAEAAAGGGLRGLLRRRRRGQASEAPTAADAAPAGEEPQTEVLPPPPPLVVPPEVGTIQGVAPAPAAGEGEAATVVEQQPADARPKFRERTRLRRRMRELRRLREISFRDLGGLTFDLRRFGRERPDLVAEKLEALQRIDAELRSIETALDARRPLTELREPGIAACPRCGTLHGTDANFCPGCGTPLRGSVVHEAGPLRVTPVGAEGPPPVGQPPIPSQPPAGAPPLGQPPVGQAPAGEPPTEQQPAPPPPS